MKKLIALIAVLALSLTLVSSALADEDLQHRGSGQVHLCHQPGFPAL